MQYYSYLHTKALEFIPQFVSGILSIVPFLIVWIISKSIFKAIAARTRDNSKNYVLKFIGRALNLVIWVIALVTMFGTWGFDVRALITGLGITSFAIGFALKDIMVNALAGIMIIFFNTLKINSKVAITGIQGKVVAMDLHYLTIEDDSAVYLIPNAKLLSENLTIFK